MRKINRTMCKADHDTIVEVIKMQNELRILEIRARLEHIEKRLSEHDARMAKLHMKHWLLSHKALELENNRIPDTL